MRNLIILLDILAIIATCFWLKSSNFDYEPIILLITLITTLIGALFKVDEKFISQNSAVIKGNGNKVSQSSGSQNISNTTNIKGSKNAINQDESSGKSINKAKVDGDKNEVNQKK